VFHILVIDDEKSQRDILNDILKDAGYHITLAEDGEKGIEKLKDSTITIVLTDLKMPNKSGLEVLREVQKINPEIQVIIMTAFGTIPSAVQAIKDGAYDYLTKPFNKEELLRVISRAADKVSLMLENKRLKEAVSDRYQFHNLIGKSAAMRQIYRMIEKISSIDATVLITGESGTGKELVARAIHHNGSRKEGPFVALNCSAIPESLIESELFGHEKGAFTGASHSHSGKFEQAQNGTIFLDEIGTMRQDLQIKLLRILQEKTVTAVGSQKSIALNVRVIAATNEDLDVLVQENRFRTDLYHRLNVFHIHLPPLRERVEDIILLTRHFMAKFTRQYNKKQLQIKAEALRKLEGYPYPGNVRELGNIIEKTMILIDRDKIGPEDIILPEQKQKRSVPAEGNTIPQTEKQMILDALRSNRGSIKGAAEALGISYKTLQYRLKKHGIDRNHFKA
jgi:DNA-binding NtrC family response regulator